MGVFDYMKTIKQIADELGVTKQAVFYRIKRPPLSNVLQSLTTKTDGVLMVNFEGEILIKQAFVKSTVKELENFGDKEPSKENTSFDGEFMKLLQDNIIVLQKQLDTKDEQIRELNERLAESNTALVAAQQSAQAAQALHAGTMQKQLIDGRADARSSRGFFSKIFGRKKDNGTEVS